MKSATTDISHILEFLACPTPRAWVEEAARPENLPTLLTDHANLERKAAESAISTMKRYGNGIPGIARPGLRNASSAAKQAALAELSPSDHYVGHHELLNKLSRLAREELRHFEQVIAIIGAREIHYAPLSASRYAAQMRKQVRAQEPERLVDTLLVGAIIEARSCERFAMLIPELDEELAAFYSSLLKSESRHFMDYLKLARAISAPDEVAQRLLELLAQEKVLIESPDQEFRFHSGVPA